LARRAGRPLRRLGRQLCRSWLGERALLARYERIFGRAFDRRDPQSFTARLFAQMLATNRSCDPVQTRLADKLLARDFVAGRVGEAHLVKLLWSGQDPAAIPFDRLPSSFVVKTNHASGQVIMVDGVHDPAAIVVRLSGWLTQNFYWALHEGQYYRIPPRILIETYLKDGTAEPLVYRHWCFDGEVAIVQVDDTTKPAIDVMSFYDSHWRRLDLQYDPRGYHRDFARPAGLDEMVAVAGKLSRGLPFVRVDLYNVAGRTYFSEMTFTPRGGELIFEPPQWDMILGAKWAAPGSIATSEELAPPEDERIAAIA